MGKTISFFLMTVECNKIRRRKPIKTLADEYFYDKIIVELNNKKNISQV